MDVHIYLHSGPDPQLIEIADKLARILALVTEGVTIMTAMDDKITELTADVAAQGTLIGSAVRAFSGVADVVKAGVDAALAAGATPEQLQSLSDADTAIRAQSASLAAAIPQGTPAVPAA